MREEYRKKSQYQNEDLCMRNYKRKSVDSDEETNMQVKKKVMNNIENCDVKRTKMHT